MEEEDCSDQQISTSRLGSLCSDSLDTRVVSFHPLPLRSGSKPSPIPIHLPSTDVVDLAWSRDDTMIATVGLDSMVFVWDASTFSELVFRSPLSPHLEADARACHFLPDMITKIGLHEGFVKGVCWDPVGEYLATQVRFISFVRTLLPTLISPLHLRSPTTSLSRSGELPIGVSPRPSRNPSTTLLGRRSSDD